MASKKTPYIKLSNQLGLFFAVLLLICFIWFYINPAERKLHEALFRLTFLGFTGMNIISLILGLIQVYVWAYIFVGIWNLISGSLKSCK